MTAKILFFRVVSVECFGAGIAHLVERPTEKPGATITRVRVPGAARNFLPVNFQCRLSYGVRTYRTAVLYEGRGSFCPTAVSSEDCGSFCPIAVSSEDCGSFCRTALSSEDCGSFCRTAVSSEGSGS